MFSSLYWGQSQFDDAVERATSELRLAEEDIALNLEICDQIRSKAVPPRDAARALRRRLTHRNPNVQLLVLALVDVCVKNGGDHFLVEISGKEFMDNLVSLLTTRDCHPDVRSRILRLVQNWATAFEGRPSLGYVAQVYKDLSLRGYDFPPKDPALANSAMVDTSTAPEWIDSDVCMRCRTPFSFTNRKHHCRNCGQVFDHQCSSRSMRLPHFGIAQEVRVCDACHTRLTTRRERKERSTDSYASPNRRFSLQRHHDTTDADLQRAIQLSLAEASSRGSSTWRASEPPLVDRTTRPTVTKAPGEEDDPDLRAAIEASLREAHAPRPSAPHAEPDPDPIHAAPAPPLPVLPNHDLHPREEDAILTFNQTVQEGAGTTDLARVHALYDQASGLRPKLALSLDDAGRKEQLLGEMHEKLSHAVKLYDQLLTEQLARPTWQRTAGSAPSRAGTWHGSYHHAPPLQRNPSQSAVMSPERVPVLSVNPSSSLSSPPAQPVQYTVQSPPPLQPHSIQSPPPPPQPHSIHSPPPPPQPRLIQSPQPQQHTIPSLPPQRQVIQSYSTSQPPPVQVYAPIFPTAPTSEPLYKPFVEKKEVALIEL